MRDDSLGDNGFRINFLSLSDFRLAVEYFGGEASFGGCIGIEVGGASVLEAGGAGSRGSAGGPRGRVRAVSRGSVIIVGL